MRLERLIVVLGIATLLAVSGASAAAGSLPLTSRKVSWATLATATTAPATIPISDALRHVWLGPARDIAALGGPQPVSILLIEDATFYFIYGGRGEEALNSTVSISSPGQVRFTSANTTGGCHVGDEGVYDWTTTPDGAGLTMTKVAEACVPRAEAVVGDWVRAACKTFGCLGDLEAGRHETAFFEPLGNRTAFTGTWRMQYGGMSYTVPSGWANEVDDPNFYNLVSQADYAKTMSDQTRIPGIVLLPDIDVAAQDEACSPSVEPGVGDGSEAMAARIARIPGLEVGAATPITVAGMSGTVLDVALEPGWSRACAVGGGVPVLRQGGEATDGLGGWDWRMTLAERWRLILLDVAEGRTMAVVIDTFAEPSRFDDLVAQAMPIITSFEFHLPAP